MSTRFSRAARGRPTRSGGTLPSATVTHHFGDEFDELVAEHAHLCVVPHRDYTPKVPQSFDEMSEGIDQNRVGRLNQLGPVIDGAIPVVTHKHYESYMAAFDKRSNSQPDVDDDCSEEFMRRALQLWEEAGKAVDWDEWDVDEELFERWLAKMDPPKQARMRKAYLELFSVEDDTEYLGEKTLSVKIEALLKRHDNKWAPRLIYAGNDHFNALTGPVAMVLCEKLVELNSKTKIGPIKFTMAYKTNDATLATTLADSPHPHPAEADFSANDLNQRAGAARTFDKFCEVVKAPRWFRELLLDMNEFTVKNLEYGHRARLENQLPTGTTITTPRNSVWNQTIEAVYAQVTHNEADAVVLGDDYLGMHKNATDPAHWSAWVAEHPKMKLTSCSPQLSGEATFLSRRLCVNTPTPCMMPKLGKALARFNVRVSPNEAISDSAYMAGKALSYAYEFRHFPMFRDLFLTRYRSEEDRAKIAVAEVSWFTRTSGVDIEHLETAILNEKVLVSEDATREFLMDAYGIECGLVTAMSISRRIILSTDLSVVTAPECLAIDFKLKPVLTSQMCPPPF